MARITFVSSNRTMLELKFEKLEALYNDQIIF